MIYIDLQYINSKFSLHSVPFHNKRFLWHIVSNFILLFIVLFLFYFFSCCLAQAENILMLDMDLPDRTTKEYQEPVIAPKVAAALKDALRDEDEIEVDASNFDRSFGLIPPTSANNSLKKPKSR